MFGEGEGRSRISSNTPMYGNLNMPNACDGKGSNREFPERVGERTHFALIHRHRPELPQKQCCKALFAETNPCKAPDLVNTCLFVEVGIILLKFMTFGLIAIIFAGN